MTYSSLNQQSALGSGGNHSHSVGIQSGLGASLVPKKPKQITFFDREGHKPGYRVPVIDKKINELTVKAKRVQHTDSVFVHAFAETVIETLGDYNPLYSKRPKKLAAALLSRVEMGRCWNQLALINSGLMYMIPGLPGVRAQRCRITVAAWELLDHWAKTFPSFEKHWLAYVDNKAKAQIYSDCFDLALGHRPASFVAIDKLAPAYQVKHEARLYREMMKQRKLEQDRKDRQLLMNQYQSASLQQAAADQYQRALAQGLGSQYMPPIPNTTTPFYPSTNPLPSSGGFVAKTTAIIKGII